MIKNIFYLLCCLALLLALGSCAGPVNKVLRDPEKFGIVRDTVFARGLCVTETTVSHDTITTEHTVYHDTAITRTVVIRVPSGCRFDTVIAGGRIVLQDGRLSYKPPATKTLIKTRTVLETKTVRDRSKEGVLEKIILIRTNESLRNKADLDKTRVELSKSKRNIWLLLVLVAGLIIYVLRNVFKSLLGLFL